MKLLWELYWAFFRIGILTIGGGLTMLPMLTHEVVEKYGWTTEDELLDYYAIGQCTPGIIAVNVATFIGYKKKGVIGGIIATLGMVSPSLLLITIIATFLNTIVDNVYVQHAFMGIRAVVCALMLNTVVLLAKKSLVSPITIAICAVAFILAFFSPIPTVVIVIMAGVFGGVYNKVKERKLS